MAYRARFAPLKADETHPFLKTDHNRGKHWARKAGNGRGMGRLVPSHPLPVTQLATRPPQSAPVGTVWKGHFVCPACRTRTDVLIRQSAASTSSRPDPHNQPQWARPSEGISCVPRVARAPRPWCDSRQAAPWRGCAPPGAARPIPGANISSVPGGRTSDRQAVRTHGRGTSLQSHQRQGP
jgi:hypothetical protein